MPPCRRGDSVFVAVGGLPYFGRRMAALIAGDGWQAAYLETRRWQPAAALGALRQAWRADVFYQLGGQIERFSRPHALLLAAPRPCVMHWTGSDVTYAVAVAAHRRAAARLRRGCVHWAGAPWLAAELAAAGVRAEWVPHSAVEAPDTLPSLGEDFTVLAYLRPGREEFYGLGAVRRVAAALPEVRVLVAGCERLPASVPANVRPLGWVGNMGGVYAQTHVLLRMTAHDGLAFMVQEALAHGRHAIWNHPFQGAITAANETEACARVAELAARHRAGTLALNEAGAAHVRERYNPGRIRDDIRARLAAVARQQQ